MLNAIKHGLGNLLNFEGRDARQAFWYYVLFIYLVTMAISMVVVIPMTIQGFLTGIRQGIAAGQSGDPQAAQVATQAAIASSMGDMMSTTMWLSLASGAIMLAVLAAAFVRRLHDSGLSGLWALIPGAIQLANLVFAPRLMRGMIENMGRMMPGDPAAGMGAIQSSFGTALLGWAAIILVIVLGVRKSTPGPNRFGEAPFTA
jgi:uncharacterized membrane protein YhaH (DUF805 family)